MKIKLIIVILIFSFLGCKKNKDSEEIIYRKGIIYTLDGEKPYTGKAYSNYEKNRIESEGYSINGQPDGEWKFFYYNGKLKKSGNYLNGKEEGQWIYYFHNGDLEGKAFFRNGEEIEKL